MSRYQVKPIAAYGKTAERAKPSVIKGWKVSDVFIVNELQAQIDPATFFLLQSSLFRQ